MNNDRFRQIEKFFHPHPQTNVTISQLKVTNEQNSPVWVVNLCFKQKRQIINDKFMFYEPGEFQGYKVNKFWIQKLRN